MLFTFFFDRHFWPKLTKDRRPIGWELTVWLHPVYAQDTFWSLRNRKWMIFHNFNLLNKKPLARKSADSIGPLWLRCPAGGLKPKKRAEGAITASSRYSYTGLLVTIDATKNIQESEGLATKTKTKTKPKRRSWNVAYERKAFLECQLILFYSIQLSTAAV